MASANVLDWKKSKVGSVELPAEVFELPWRVDLAQALVRWQLASRRAGTHNTKRRGDVSGGGKKPYKQKGTGNARRGSQRSPLIRGGAVVFGPSPRDYSYELPKKFKRKGVATVLSKLLKDGNLFVVGDMKSTEGKAKELSERLKKFGVEKAVLIDSKKDTNFSRAARNLKNYRYYAAAGLNVYDMMRYGNVVLTKESIADVVSRCMGTTGGEK
jgi:large subunit ribosomal protein L4